MGLDPAICSPDVSPATLLCRSLSHRRWFRRRPEPDASTRATNLQRTHDDRCFILGAYGSALCVLLFASPLSTMFEVLSSANAASIYAPLTATQCANCAMWTIYGLGIGDVNGDGAPDFLESSWQTAALLTSRASADSLTGLAWLDSAAARGLEVDISGGCYGFGDDAPDQCYGWGSELGDIDNDGDLDAWMTFGFWSTYGAVRRYEHDALWLQDADGQFAQVGSDPFWDIDDDGANRGLVLADVNDDGWLDAVVRSLEGGGGRFGLSWIKHRFL